MADMIDCADWTAWMPQLQSGSADLVLCDPPYAVSSKSTGFTNTKLDKYAKHHHDFGTWDYAEIDLDKFAAECFRILRKGGTAIIFYDIWKVSGLKDALEAAGFAMFRLIVWQKTNPVPVNSAASYLSNAREIAVCCVKGGKATFHSKFDNGLYEMNSVVGSSKQEGGGVQRFHPTQKPVALFRKLIEKHSNTNDLVVDPFSGSGTTAAACIMAGRRFAGCEIDATYCAKANERAALTAAETNPAGSGFIVEEDCFPPFVSP